MTILGVFVLIFPKTFPKSLYFPHVSPFWKISTPGALPVCLGCRGTICLPRNYQIFSIGFHYRPLVSTTTTEVEIFQQEELSIYFYQIKTILIFRCVEGSHPKFMRTKSSRRKKRWINTKELFPHQSVELINGGKNRREEKNILNSSKINKEEEKPWLWWIKSSHYVSSVLKHVELLSSVNRK